MTKIKTLVLSGLIAAAAIFSPTPARAVVECDQLSGGVGICLPRYGTDFDQWATATINAFTLLNGTAAVSGSTTAYSALGWISVNRISGMSSGTADIRISSTIYQDSGFSSTWLSSMTVTSGAGLKVNYGIRAASMSLTADFTASSGTFTGGGGLGVTYGITAGSASITALTAPTIISSVTVIGGGGILVTYGVNASTFVGNGAGLTSITAANISAGILGPSVIASSVAASGVGAKTTCGSATVSCSFDINVDGRVTRVSSATISASGAAIDTIQMFKATGCSTYTTAASARQIVAEFCAGGGGGAGSGNGGNGGASSFGSVVASSGMGGDTSGNGGAGGSGGIGTAIGVFSSSSVFCARGNGGGVNNNTVLYEGGPGGGSAFWGGGGNATVATPAPSGAANTGGGGSSDFNTANVGAGGGGQCCRVTIWGASLAASFPICIGVGGTASGDAGAGGTGFGMVTEKF